MSPRSMRPARWLIGASLFVASCRLGHPTHSPSDDYPRCFASDPDGNRMDCKAPARVYDGDPCNCADRSGRILFGRAREHPPQ